MSVHDTKNITQFWNNHPNRVYLRDKVYPKLGAFLRNQSTQNVCEIGAEYYNKNIIDYYKTPNICLWVIDKFSDLSKEMNNHRYLLCPFEKLLVKYPGMMKKFNLINSVDVIFDVPLTFTEKREYLNTVHSLLMPNGIFYVTVPLKGHDYKGLTLEDRELLFSKFELSNRVPGIPSYTISPPHDNEKEFYVLQRSKK